MTQKNREAMQRAIGIIEGVSFGVDAKVGDALTIAIQLLENMLVDEEEQG